MADNGWAFIDTERYWDKGTNKVGEYGMVDFISDDVSRRITRQYRKEYTNGGRYLDINYYVIKVQSKTKAEQVIALYDDNAHSVLFDSYSMDDFLIQMDVHLRFDDSKDIVVMAKKRRCRAWA